ncbi:MAG: C39 family peptidase [Candidatus Sericytochromatia bacterium]
MNIQSVANPAAQAAAQQTAPATRFQTLMQGFQSRLDQSPELRETLKQLPDGQNFVDAVARLAQNSEVSPDDVTSLQNFLKNVPGSRITARGVDGKFGAQTQNALQQFFRTSFTPEGLARLQPPIPQPRPDNASGVRNRPPADFNPVSPLARTPGSLDGQAVQSQRPIDAASFHAQYDSNIASARAADCGPASVAMILESQGFGDRNSGDVREDLMNVDHHGATTSEELVRGIETGSRGQLNAEIIRGNVDYANDPEGFLNRMREELGAGKQVILLTKNLGVMANGTPASGANGHYVVIQGITADNQLILADPGSRGKGLNRTIPADLFLAAYAARGREGMHNNLITVERRTPAQ